MQTIKNFPKWFAKQKLSGKIVIGGITLILLCCICSIPFSIIGNFLPDAEPTSTNAFTATIPATEVIIESTETNIPEFTPTEIYETSTVVSETATPSITPTDTPEPTFTPETGALLPGLMSSDVVVNLENEGLSCGSVQQGELYYVRTCKLESVDYSLIVEIYGRDLFSVDLIDSSVIQFSNPDINFAATFLGFVATMPYDGAVQQEARDWVENTVPALTGQGDVREQNFGGVNYRVYGIPTFLNLEMGDLP